MMHAAARAPTADGLLTYHRLRHRTHRALLSARSLCHRGGPRPCLCVITSARRQRAHRCMRALEADARGADRRAISARRGRRCKCAALSGDALNIAMSCTAWADPALVSDGLPSTSWAELLLSHQPALLSMAGHSHEAHDAAFGMAQQLDSLVSGQLTGASP